MIKVDYREMDKEWCMKLNRTPYYSIKRSDREQCPKCGGYGIHPDTAQPCKECYGVGYFLIKDDRS